ncbi:MAG: hypothetical protein QM300_13925, partial [Pseudomonadota bacterium]|nr:hypothetical protein [Pseudomonadota bacterium]
QDVSIRIEMDGSIISWFDSYNYQKVLDIRRIPRKVIKMVKKRLPGYIQDIESNERYNYWRQFRATAREGVIVRKSQEKIDVDLGGQTGFMTISHTIKGENYIPGQSKQFYILKVSKSNVIYLSRKTRSLPAALFAQALPWGTFVCTRRIPGVRSHIITDTYLQNKKILRDVSKELGEIITWEIDGSISRRSRIAQVV